MIYTSELYVSLAQMEYKTLFLETLGTAVSVRKISGTKYVDAIGPYPFTNVKTNFNCDEVLAELRSVGLVSLTLVANPMTSERQALERYFSPVKTYKEHYLLDYQEPIKISKHHRYEVRKALRACRVEEIRLADHLEAWSDLYSNLQRKHRLGERHAFSNKYFSMLSSLNELTTIGAFDGDQLVSCSLWLRSRGFVYNHLAASSPAGYRCSAAYAIYDFAIRHFANFRAINLGGVPDKIAAGRSLSFFKKGFANRVVPVYLCGLIVNPVLYAELSVNSGAGQAKIDGDFFPAYRAPES